MFRIAPRALVAASAAIWAALRRLAQRLSPPQVSLIQRATGIEITAALGAVVALGIPDLLAHEPRTAGELALRTGVHPEALARTMRALVAMDVFERGRDGRFRNNRLSQPLRRGVSGSVADFIAYFASPANLSAWTDFPATVASGGNAFERVHGATIWEYLGAHPAEGAVFAGAMADLTRLDAPAIARAGEFGRFPRVCDVAGGRGTLLARILELHPDITGVLFDEAHVLSGAADFLEGRGLSSRVVLSSGSFFEGVPPGCDAYVLKDVLHDWDDRRASRILSMCRAAMAPGSTLMIVEILVEEDSRELPGPLVDLQMMTVCSEGRQRSRAQMRALLEGSRFALRRVTRTAAPPSIVEAAAV
jgi:hypothetical protein